MKKMAKLNDPELEIQFWGMSNRKGIYLRVEKIKEDKEEQTCSIYRYPGAYAYRAEDGSVKVDSEYNSDILEEEMEHEKKANSLYEKIKIGFLIASIITVLSSIPCFFLNQYLGCLCIGMTLIFWGLHDIPSVVYGIFKRITGDEDYIQMYKFHSAEHAAVNAYCDLKRVPTIKEIKNYSNYAYGCGVAQAFKKVWFYLGIGICRLLPGLWFFAALLIFSIVTIVWYRKNFFFTEIFSLIKPTEFEYEVAIKAMTYASKEKEQIENEFECVISELEKLDDDIEIPGQTIIIQIGDPEDLENE